MGNAKDWNTGAELIANHIIENHPEFKVGQREPPFYSMRVDNATQDAVTHTVDGAGAYVYIPGVR
jgi:hypothetical protein